MAEPQITIQPIVYKRDALRIDPFFRDLGNLAGRVAKEVGGTLVFIGASEFYREARDEFVYRPYIDFIQGDTRVRVEFRRHRDPPHTWVPYMFEVCGYPIPVIGEKWSTDTLHEYIVEKLREGPWVPSPRLSALFRRVRTFVKSLLSR